MARGRRSFDGQGTEDGHSDVHALHQGSDQSELLDKGQLCSQQRPAYLHHSTLCELGAL